MRLIIGLMVGLIPVVIFGRLLPLLAPLAIIVMLVAIAWNLVGVKLSAKMNARRWRDFTSDRAWVVAPSPHQNPTCWVDPVEGKERLSALRFDLARKLVAFDIYPHETPVCVAIDEIREIHLVDLVGASTSIMNTLGVRLVLKRKTAPNLYTDDARQLLKFITEIKSSRSSTVTAQSRA